MSFIYMLKSKNPRGATKVYQWQNDGTLRRTHTYNAGYEFMAAKLPRGGALETIEQLSELLTSAEDEPEWFAIRGELRSGQEYVDGVNRQYLDKNECPHWMEPEGGQRWLTLDIDGMALPESVILDDAPLVAASKWVASRLPEPFASASFHYHHSASAGLIKLADEHYRPGFDEARLHLSFMLDRPVCNQSIRDWVKANSSSELPIDAALFNPVQPHFTADPVFEGGPDPLSGQRSGLVRRGSDTVKAPKAWVLPVEYEERMASERSTRRMFASFAPRRASPGYFKAALASADQNIRSAREGDRHATVYRESAAIGELVHQMDEAHVINTLTSAAQSTVEPSRHHDMARTVIDAIEQGKLSPRGAPEPVPQRDPTRSQPRQTESSRRLDEIQVDIFRKRFADSIPDDARRVLDGMTPREQDDVWKLAEHYASVGWSWELSGPVNELDAIITARCVVEHNLDRMMK